MTDALNARSIALMRCMIAVTILWILWLAPFASYWSVTLTHASFTAYAIYSFVIALITYRSHWQSPPKSLLWLDVYFFAWLTALGYPSGEAYYQCFFYPIFVASFTKGFREGLLVSVVSFFLFLLIGSAYAVNGTQFGFSHSVTLIRAGYLLVVGYTFAYCGGYGGLFMRKLAFLKEVNNQWHPRIGIDQLYGCNLDRLLAFFNGDACILVLHRENQGTNYAMYTSSRDRPGQSIAQHNVAEEAAAALLKRLPSTHAAYYHDKTVSIGLAIRGHQAYDIHSGAKSKAFHDMCAEIANLLDTTAFVTVPFVQHGSTAGRIFLTSNRRGFTGSDVDFLLQASNAISTVIENMHLVEELITKAAEQERSSISRDLHDTTIQPYIGLKLALEALSREATAENPLSRRIHELIKMAEMTVEDLRDFAATIKGKGAMPGEAMLAAISTQADRLRRFYGINVQITSDISTRLKGRLAAEVFQIISEAISNILRHTKARNVYISVRCNDTSLQLEITNDEGDGKDFEPRSIVERVRTLNGRTSVEHRLNQHTVVAVTVPL